MVSVSERYSEVKASSDLDRVAGRALMPEKPGPIPWSCEEWQARKRDYLYYRSMLDLWGGRPFRILDAILGEMERTWELMPRLTSEDIASLTGLDAGNVRRELAALKRKGMVVGAKGYRLGLVMDHMEWDWGESIPPPKRVIPNAPSASLPTHLDGQQPASYPTHLLPDRVNSDTQPASPLTPTNKEGTTYPSPSERIDKGYPSDNPGHDPTRDPSWWKERLRSVSRTKRGTENENEQASILVEFLELYRPWELHGEDWVAKVKYVKKRVKPLGGYVSAFDYLWKALTTVKDDLFEAARYERPGSRRKDGGDEHGSSDRLKAFEKYSG